MTQKRKYSTLLIFISSVLGVYIFFQYLLPLCYPFFIGYFIAWFSTPIIGFLSSKCRMKKNIAGVLTVSLFILLCVIVSYIFGRMLLMQLVQLIENFPAIQRLFERRMISLCGYCDRMFRLKHGTIHATVVYQLDRMVNTIQTNFIPQFSDEAVDFATTIVRSMWNIAIIFISAVLFAKDRTEIKEEYKKSFIYREVHLITAELSVMGIAYFKAQLILLAIIAVVCSIGVFLIGNHYALLIGIGIAIFDAFPILGSSAILIPWTLILVLQKKMGDAVIIFITYLICQLVRQLLEPKLVGDVIGVRSIYTLMSIYIGAKLYGVLGFLLGPLSLVSIRAVYHGILCLVNMQEEKKTEGNSSSS